MTPRYCDGDSCRAQEGEVHLLLAFAQRASRVKGHWTTKKTQLGYNSHEAKVCKASYHHTT
jgi:hypothetical protein